MSCPGDACGAGHATIAPAMDGPAVQAKVVKDAALDAAERNMRTTYVLAADTPMATLSTRLIVPSRLRVTSRG